MSFGHCACPCSEWRHGGVCTGEADTSRPLRPSLRANLEVPVCRACADRITPALAPSTVAPLTVDYNLDAPALTAAMLRDAGTPVPPPPTGRAEDQA